MKWNVVEALIKLTPIPNASPAAIIQPSPADQPITQEAAPGGDHLPFMSAQEHEEYMQTTATRLNKV
jgi:hypothetical protein